MGKTKVNHVNCLICDCELEFKPSENPMVINSLDGGLWFMASGNYGSTLFDPINEEKYLQIAICDKCVKKNQDKVSHIFNIRSEKTAEIEEASKVFSTFQA